MAEDDDFLSRWSRRKAQARAGLKKKEPEEKADAAVAEAPAMPGAEQVAPQGGQVALRGGTGAGEPREMTPEEAEEAYRDFDFDALDAQSDYTRFMKKGVPEWVRQKALRKLWTSDPVFANLDGLVDYGEDFTDAALAVKELATSWKPGQGYRTDEEMQRDREEYGPEEQRIAARREREEREAREAAEAREGTGDTDAAGEEAEAAAAPGATTGAKSGPKSGPKSGEGSGKAAGEAAPKPREKARKDGAPREA